MAQFTKVHGDYQPVVVMDSGVANAGPGAGYSSGLYAITDGVTVQPQGPKLDYWTVTASGSSSFSTTQINTIVETVQQLATIYIYQFDAAGPDTFAFAAYPTGAWNLVGSDPNNLDDAITAALTAAGEANAVVVTTGATFSG